MLARIDDHLRHAGLLPEAHKPIAYDGFPWWAVVRTKSMREEHAAEWLQRVDIYPYLPQYSTKVRCRGLHSHRHVMRAAIPGLLFVPVDMLKFDRRDELFNLAGIYGVLTGADGSWQLVPKLEMQKVYLLEAKLNLPPESMGHFFKIGQKVRFKDESEWASWIGGEVVEFVDEIRIKVMVPGLFGRHTIGTFPATEFEAL